MDIFTPPVPPVPASAPVTVPPTLAAIEVSKISLKTILAITAATILAAACLSYAVYWYIKTASAGFRQRMRRWLGIKTSTPISKHNLVVHSDKAVLISKACDESGIEVTKARSATVVVDASGYGDEYFETVIYDYPSWEPIESFVGVSEVPLDFLEFGKYGVAVFSVKDVQGYVAVCQNCNRPKPDSKIPRQLGSEEFANTHSESTAHVAEMLAPSGHVEVISFESSPISVWPSPIYTRIENVSIKVPEDAAWSITSVPSFGFVKQNSPLGEIVHERNSTAFYRSETNGETIDVTAIYPNVSPESSISPKVSIFLFSPN